MPRGDGRKSGEPRPFKKKTGLARYVPKWLAQRVGVWEESKMSNFTTNDKHDGKGNSFRKPGSQKR